MVLAFIGCWLPITTVNLAKDFSRRFKSFHVRIWRKKFQNKNQTLFDNSRICGRWLRTWLQCRRWFGIRFYSFGWLAIKNAIPRTSERSFIHHKFSPRWPVACTVCEVPAEALVTTTRRVTYIDVDKSRDTARVRSTRTTHRPLRTTQHRRQQQQQQTTTTTTRWSKTINTTRMDAVRRWSRHRRRVPTVDLRRLDDGIRCWEAQRGGINLGCKKLHHFRNFKFCINNGSV